MLMETTAKVDIRKLQTLNDCINRTIEALNQVRLSVYGGGIGHSAPLGLQGIGTPAYFGGNFPGAFQSPFGLNAQQAAMVNPAAFATLGAMAGFPNAFAANAAGLGHSAFDPRFNGTVDPRFNSTVDPRFTNNWDWTTADPYAQNRIAQTFPFVGWGQSPFGWQNV
jgi:hypothetical protein